MKKNDRPFGTGRSLPLQHGFCSRFLQSRNRAYE